MDHTGTKPTSDLSETEDWPKLSVLLRYYSFAMRFILEPLIIFYISLLLTLAFDDMICVLQYLPELFHIVLMVFATGSAPVRASSHGLLVNCVHSLYTAMVTPENKLQSLQYASQLFVFVHLFTTLIVSTWLILDNCLSVSSSESEDLM